MVVEGHKRKGDMKSYVIFIMFSHSFLEIEVCPKSHRELGLFHLEKVVVDFNRESYGNIKNKITCKFSEVTVVPIPQSPKSSLSKKEEATSLMLEIIFRVT